ncbi:MAG: CBS domain-containing protein [Chloroflexota bacterium]
MSLENDLQQEQVIHLDLTEFTVVDGETSVQETVKQMREADHHCAFVTKNDVLEGIFTDRDILRKVVGTPEVWSRPIKTVMTASPLTVAAADPADKALALMDEKHFRNVPVLDEQGQIVGNLTHYAVIKYLCDRFPESVYNLPPDPDQVADDRIGA